MTFPFDLIEHLWLWGQQVQSVKVIFFSKINGKNPVRLGCIVWRNLHGSQSRSTELVSLLFSSIVILQLTSWLIQSVGGAFKVQYAYSSFEDMVKFQVYATVSIHWKTLFS